MFQTSLLPPWKSLTTDFLIKPNATMDYHDN